MLEEQRRRQYTTEGAQVHELPTTRKEGAQTEEIWSVDRVLYEVFGRDWATTADRATQTPTPVALRTTGMQTCSPPRPPTPPRRTSETQTSPPPDYHAKETQTLSPTQQTVRTQVDITTYNLGMGCGTVWISRNRAAQKTRPRIAAHSADRINTGPIGRALPTGADTETAVNGKVTRTLAVGKPAH